jgi:hypothetical protein
MRSGTFLVEFFGPYGGLLHTAMAEGMTAMAACEKAAQQRADSGGRTDKCTGFSVRQVGSYAVLISETA